MLRPESSSHHPTDHKLSQPVDEVCLPNMLMPSEEKSLEVRALRPLAERRSRSDPRTQKWLYALLLYNTCVAPMSTYCADNIFQYGIDVAKYNFIYLFFKLLREVGHLLYCGLCSYWQCLFINSLARHRSREKYSFYINLSGIWHIFKWLYSLWSFTLLSKCIVLQSIW